MIRYDMLRLQQPSLRALLACFACVLPGPAFMSICLSISLRFCRAGGRVSLSVPACVFVCACLYGLFSMQSLFAMHMYVCMWICMYACMCLRISIWISTYVYVYVYGYLHMYVDLYRYSMPSQPASQPESKEQRSSCHTLRTMYEHVPYRVRSSHTHTTLYTAAYAPITMIINNNNNNNNHRGLMMILAARIVRTVRYPASRPCSQHCSLLLTLISICMSLARSGSM